MPNYRPPGDSLRSLTEQFGEARTDYAAAKPSRFKRQRYGLLPYGSSNDWSLRVPTDYYSVVEQARDMDRNDALVGQMLTRACDNVLQEGMRPDPQSGDKGFDSQIRARWQEWSSSPEQCDQAGESDFDGLCFLALRQFLIDGDHFDLLLRDGQIQGVEGHRCRSILKNTDDTVLGVEVDRHRRARAFHFSADTINPLQAGFEFADAHRYPVRDAGGERLVCQVLDRKRSSQTRGMSVLTPIIDTAGMCDDLLFAALVKQQISACFAIFHERELGSEPTGDLGQFGSRSTAPNLDGTNQTSEGLGPGMRIKGDPGEKLQGFSPQVPGEGFHPHVRLVINIMAVNLGMPLILALLDASETNFSSWRGAVEEARKGFRRLQNVLRSRFLVPVYRWKVRQWIHDDGLARAMTEEGKLAPLRHRWNKPAWPYIEKLKDAQADSHRLENGLISPRRLFHENGIEWRDHVNESIDDLTFAIVRAKRRASQINARYRDAEPIGWRDLLFLPNAAGTTTRITDKAADDDDTAPVPRQREVAKNKGGTHART